MRKKYCKKANQFITAVQLDFKTEGFTYQKWGSTQQAKPGDWLVKNGNDTYTIDNEVFEKTYCQIDDAKYVKTTPIWAEKTTKDGSIKTKEGKLDYQIGDYLVSNSKDGSDDYCIDANKFQMMYELIN